MHDTHIMRVICLLFKSRNKFMSQSTELFERKCERTRSITIRQLNVSLYYDFNV